MDRERYFKAANFEALKMIKPAADSFGLRLLEVTFRCCVYHSKLKILERSDGIVIGISYLLQLRDNPDYLEKGRLLEETIKESDAAW